MSNKYIPQVWQVDLDYPAHLPSDEALGITHLNWKVSDGPHWMRLFDPRGITGPDHWRMLTDDFAARGITLTPWCVPTWTGNHALELNIASSVIEVSGEMVFNIEFWGDQYFWQGGRAGIVPYIGELRRRFPQAHFTIQYDTRWPDSVHVHDWLPYVDHVIDMSYWPDFGEDMATVLFRSYARMKALGRPFSFTYPGTAPSYPDWQIDEAPIYVFRRGNMTPACVALVQSGAVSEPPPKPQPPDPPKGDCKATFAEVSTWLTDKAARAEIRAARLAEITTELGQWQIDEAAGAVMERKRLAELEAQGDHRG